METIGIIGSGVVGQALAKGFNKHGYQTYIGSRSEEKRNDLSASLSDTINVVDTKTAASQDIVVFAVKGTQALEALADVKDQLSGKIVIDTTNPIADTPPENGVVNLFTDHQHSLMEQLQKAAPEARFVKAFSCIGNAYMIDPDFNGVTPTMFICGNDDNARKRVNDLLVQFSWEVEDMGSAVSARAIEPLVMLWCIPGMLNGQWSHAFKLLKE